MGRISGAGEFSASGYIGAAVIGAATTLSFRDFVASAETMPLRAVLTINGNLKKRQIDLGYLPSDAACFDLAVPDGTDISLFNTVVLRLSETDIAVAIGSIP
ncbi:MAG: hypothetical protein KGQ93_13490 [Cyanobacteria bacterium REEB459]|nr:hypothetical protein [Cyanobacteria bacterium REEB459]